MRQLFQRAWRTAEFTNPEAVALRETFVSKLAPHAAEQTLWSRTAKWERSFEVFARRQFKAQQRPFNFTEALGNDELCGLFIIAVAKEGKGYTRSGAARACLNKLRAAAGLGNLNGNQQIALTIRGDRRRQPRTKRQAEAITEGQVQAIESLWGGSKYWWRRQIALMICLGFTTLMRSGELRAMTREGVLWCSAANTEATFEDLVARDAGQALPIGMRGVLFHVPWRKATQHEDAWIPGSCGRVMRLLWKHLWDLRTAGVRSVHLFPPKEGSNVACKPKLSAPTPMKSSTFRSYLKKAVAEVSPKFNSRDLQAFGGHSLRVGGANMLRRRGVDSNVIRMMGGWASLCSTAGYMQASTTEQFKLTDRMGVRTSGTRKSAFTASAAKKLFETLPPL